MTNKPHDRCPVDPDETAERYLMGRLSREDTVAFEDHFVGCTHCSERVQFTQDFVIAVRDAARRLRSRTAGA